MAELMAALFNVYAHTAIMTLKNAAFLPLAGGPADGVVVRRVHPRRSVCNSGLIPAIRMMRSLVYVVASVASMFFYVLHKSRS